MNHAALTNAVRASLSLAPTPSERREECGHLHLVPGAERTADDSRRVATRVHAREGKKTGRDGRPPAPTCTCEEFGPDLYGHYGLVEDPGCHLHGWDLEPIPHRIPGTARHA